MFFGAAASRMRKSTSLQRVAEACAVGDFCRLLRRYRVERAGPTSPSTSFAVCVRCVHILQFTAGLVLETTPVSDAHRRRCAVAFASFANALPDYCHLFEQSGGSASSSMAEAFGETSEGLAAGSLDLDFKELVGTRVAEVDGGHRPA